MDWIKVTQDRIKVGVFVNKVAYIRIRLPDETTTLKGNYTHESSGELCNLYQITYRLSLVACLPLAYLIKNYAHSPAHSRTCYQKEVV